MQKFQSASGPQVIPTEGPDGIDLIAPAAVENRSLVLFGRGDEVTVEAKGGGHPFSACLWKTVARARGVVGR